MSDGKVAIVGGGLSAIYAFYGAQDAGYKPADIEMLVSGFSSKLGAVFMYHSPIMWKPAQVDNILLGTCDIYEEKQWGSIASETSAHRRFLGGTRVKVTEFLFDWEGLYQTLWDLVPVVRRTGILSPKDLRDLKKTYKAVICTFSHPNVKQEYLEKNLILPIPISFESTQQSSPIYEVIYNGLPNVPWVRKTIMPGRTYTEYPNGMTARDVEDYEIARSPEGISRKVSMVPDIHPRSFGLTWEDRKENNLFRVGRQAIFSPKYLSHEAREDTRKFLEEL
jgi:hypothetical protein